MRRSSKGFTLIELLVIVSVISVLSSIIYSNVNNARVKAKIAAAQATLSNAFVGAVLCVEGGEQLNSNPGTGGVCDTGGNFFLAPQGLPICNSSDNVWPDIADFGFSYQICMSSVQDNQLVMLTTDGFWDIVCAYNFSSPQIDNQGRCDVLPNNTVGTCTDGAGGGSGDLCKINASSCPVGEFCERLTIN